MKIIMWGFIFIKKNKSQSTGKGDYYEKSSIPR